MHFLSIYCIKYFCLQFCQVNDLMNSCSTLVTFESASVSFTPLQIHFIRLEHLILLDCFNGEYMMSNICKPFFNCIK